MAVCMCVCVCVCVCERNRLCLCACVEMDVLCSGNVNSVSALPELPRIMGVQV